MATVVLVCQARRTDLDGAQVERAAAVHSPVGQALWVGGGHPHLAQQFLPQGKWGS